MIEDDIKPASTVLFPSGGGVGKWTKEELNLLEVAIKAQKRSKSSAIGEAQPSSAEALCTRCYTFTAQLLLASVLSQALLS